MRGTGISSIIVGLLLIGPMAAARPPVRQPQEEAVSRSAVIPQGSVDAMLFQVPEGREYLMRQACKGTRGPSGSSASAIVVGSVLGIVPLTSGFESPACTTFEPGVVFVGGEALTCERREPSQTFDEITCLINGVLR